MDAVTELALLMIMIIVWGTTAVYGSIELLIAEIIIFFTALIII